MPHELNLESSKSDADEYLSESFSQFGSKEVPRNLALKHNRDESSDSDDSPIMMRADITSSPTKMGADVNDSKKSPVRAQLDFSDSPLPGNKRDIDAEGVEMNSDIDIPKIIQSTMV